MSQNHEAFPLLTELILTLTVNWTHIGQHRPFRDFHKKLDECLGADGIYFDDLQKIEYWLSNLTTLQFDLMVGRHKFEITEVFKTAPLIAGKVDGARTFITDTCEYCLRK